MARWSKDDPAETRPLGDDGYPVFKMVKGAKSEAKIVQGEFCFQPLEDQIFDEEWAALAALRVHCEEAKHYEDDFLLMCLFARKLSIKRTIELVQANWKFRVENQLETLPKFEDLDMSFFNSSIVAPGTRSKDGYGVIYLLMDRFDPKKIDIDKMVKATAWYLINFTAAFGMDVARNGAIMVEDLKGFGWKHFDLKFQKRMMQMFQDTFPQRMKRALILNPPSIMKIIMTLIKPFMKQKMIDRFVVIDRSKLSEYIDPSQMHELYGGAAKYTHEEWYAAMRKMQELREQGEFPHARKEEVSEVKELKENEKDTKVKQREKTAKPEQGEKEKEKEVRSKNSESFDI